MSLKQRRKLLRVLFWVVSILMVAFVAGGFFLPRRLKVLQSITIRADAVATYDKLQSFKQWESWAPWFQRDRFVEKQFEGAESGPGAVMTWKSQSEGDGSIRVVSALIPQTVNMTVRLGDYGEAETWFELNDAGGGLTEVTWGFQTDFGQNMARRYFGLLFAGRVKRDLQEGLQNLKKVLEQPVAASGNPSASHSP